MKKHFPKTRRNTLADLFSDVGEGFFTVYTPEQEQTVAAFLGVLAKTIEEENLFAEISGGFADAEYFGRCFKKAYGSSPRDFRKKQTEKEKKPC